MAATQRPPDGSTPPANSKTKKISMDEMFDLMSSGFLRGGIGFGGELLKTTMPQEVRVGVTQVTENSCPAPVRRIATWRFRSFLYLI